MMDISELKPDQELDVAVPEGVTPEAWTDHQFNSAVAEGVMGWRAHEGSIWFTLDGQRRYYTYEWDPKHRIDHAWQVVERLIAMEYTVKVAQDTESDYQRWLASLYRGQEMEVGRFADTAPRAICLVALAAMEAGCTDD